MHYAERHATWNVEIIFKVVISTNLYDYYLHIYLKSLMDIFFSFWKTTKLFKHRVKIPNRVESNMLGDCCFSLVSRPVMTH